jgi:hypothetical protein
MALGIVLKTRTVFFSRFQANHHPDQDTPEYSAKLLHFMKFAVDILAVLLLRE